MGMRLSVIVHSNWTDFKGVGVLRSQRDLHGFATQVFGDTLFKRFVEPSDRDNLSAQVERKDSGISAPASARDCPARKRSVNMHVAIRDDLSARRDHGHHNQIAISGVNLLA